MERLVGEREGEKMRHGLIMVCAGCNTGAESGAYKAERGETPIAERPGSERRHEPRRGMGDECVESEWRRVGRVTCKRTVN